MGRSFIKQILFFNFQALSLYAWLSLPLAVPSLFARDANPPTQSPRESLASELEPVRLASENHSFAAADGINIVYTRFVDARGASARPIVISPGRAQSSNHYIEMAKDLLERGYGPIYVLHHRGQGASQRLLADGTVSHVQSFDHYVDDFIRFVEGPLTQDLAARGIRERPFLLAHSMGGAIADLALEAKPGLFDRVVYLAPMFELEMPNRILGMARSRSARKRRLFCQTTCLRSETEIYHTAVQDFVDKNCF